METNDFAGWSSQAGKRIYAILITQVYNRAAIAVIGSVVNAVILVFILWKQVSHPALVIWLATVLIAAILRILNIRAFQRTAEPNTNFRRWGWNLVLHIGISGALWGSCAIFLFPIESTAHQAFIAFVLAGMVAGAVGVFSAILKVFLAFSIPALAPIFWRFISIGDDLHVAMGIMTVLFGCLTFLTAKRINSSIKQVVVLKESFADRLVERTAELQKLNERLREEIKVRRLVEQELREGEARFRTLADNIAQFAWMADPNGSIFWYNKRWHDYTGTTLPEMAGYGWKKIPHPDHLERVTKSLKHSWDTGEPWEDIMPLRGKDGRYRWFLSRALPIRDEKGRIVRWFGTNTDITERLRAEEQIKKSLNEKEILLQEVHHRVKNNMQVIISLMNLQASKIKHEDLKAHFQQAASRVTAMALIHDILYRSDSLGEINLKDYLHSLIRGLAGMYSTVGVTIHISTESIQLDMDRAIPCGLIINELVSNALKYAFPGNRTGQIRIEAAIEPPNTLVLTILDNGIGLPPYVEVGKTDTLGLKLVLGLTENQLGGELEVNRSHGTCYRIKFPLTLH
jgi:PAS domain S-box-containing protein